jgi:hypothetical protein
MLTRQHQAALAEGIADDTSEMDRRIISGIQHEFEAARQRQIETSAAAVRGMQGTPAIIASDDNTAIEKVVGQLDRDAAGHHAVWLANEATPQSIAEDLPPPASPAPPRRSMPVSAPVSRDVPSVGGRRGSDTRTITLTAEQRDLAHRSYSWLSKADAEMEYAVQRAKMLRMRSDGTLNE